MLGLLAKNGILVVEVQTHVGGASFLEVLWATSEPQNEPWPYLWGLALALPHRSEFTSQRGSFVELCHLASALPLPGQTENLAWVQALQTGHQSKLSQLAAMPPANQSALSSWGVFQQCRLLSPCLVLSFFFFWL